MTVPSPPQPAMAKPSNWDPSIESLRGLAIALVVALHATDQPVAGLTRQGNEHYPIYAYLADSLMNVRMPLFTILSGFLYGLRPIGRQSPGPFALNKARRILLPMFCAVTATLVLGHWVGSELAFPPSELYRAYLFSYTHFWYLQAITLIFVFVGVADYAQGFATPARWSAALVIAALAKHVLPHSAFMSFTGAVYLLPYFVLGLGLVRFKSLLDSRPLALALTAIAAVTFSLQQVVLLKHLPVDLSKGGVLGTVIGLSMTYVAMRYRRPIPGLAALGVYAYTIYLYHHIGISVGQRVFAKLGLESYDGLYAVKCVAGLASGVAVHLVLMRIPGLRTVALGMAPKRPNTEAAPLAVVTEAAASPQLAQTEGAEPLTKSARSI